MKLLDTNGSNTKVKKGISENVRVASLSLYPDPILCPFSITAGCADPCLAESGRGAFDNVRESRKRKSEFLHNDLPGFLDQLRAELFNFSRVCYRAGVSGFVRLNTFSDVPFETRKYGYIPQSFPELTFYDYSKCASRINRLPENYKLMFSYSSAPKYQREVRKALKTDIPISAVFAGPFPDRFLDRPVIDGDASDLNNLEYAGHIVALKYKAPRDGRKIDIQSNPLIIASS